MIALIPFASRTKGSASARLGWAIKSAVNETADKIARRRLTQMLRTSDAKESRWKYTTSSGNNTICTATETTIALKMYLSGDCKCFLSSQCATGVLNNL